jgi:myo-inositol 2-dehydrogenase / D-chiro-inositol 1-dehydrogenase
MRIGLAGVGRVGVLHAATLRDLQKVDSLVVAYAAHGRAGEVARTLEVDLPAAPFDAAQ